MNNIKILILCLFVFIILFSCGKNKADYSVKPEDVFVSPITKDPLPAGLIWLTNDQDSVFASSDAKKGGTIRSYMLNYLNTFRTVGPDSNQQLIQLIVNNNFSLINFHPNTGKIIPEIATHWAFDKDNKTMYFKLNKNVKWSDGAPVTAHDFAYTVEFMRSKHIISPFYNDYFTSIIEKVTVFDDWTLSVSTVNPLPEIEQYVGFDFIPTPRHYYGKLNEDFVSKYNWAIVPNTGAYQISDFKKGKYIIFSRKKDWWADDLKYFRYRFNADKIVFKVLMDVGVAWEYFKKGEIDIFRILTPEYWHDKDDEAEFKNGYIKKIWFYNDTQQSAYGIFLNQDKEIFKDKNIRYAFAHSMNIDKVLKTVLRGDFYRLESGFTGYGDYSNNNIKARRYDLEKVNYYMKNSGWNRGEEGIWIKNGMKFSVEITYSVDDYTQQLVVLKEEAKKAGLELILDKLDPASGYKKIMEKKHEASMGGWTTNTRPEYWQIYHSDNAHKPQTNNITNNDNKELDKLIDKYRFSSDVNERKALSIKIQEIIYDIGDFVPTIMRPYTREWAWRYLKLPEIPGTKISGANNPSLFEPFSAREGGLFWIDQDMYKETKEAVKKGKKFEPVTIIDETYKMDILKEK